MALKTNTKRKPSHILTRYTTLPMLLDVLERRCLTLLSPESWPDRNDREVMLDYKKRRNLTCLLAVCFCQGEETIHHWSAFAPDSAGCRIEFDLPALISSMAKQSRIRHGKVTYKKINTLLARDLSDEKRPFIKRWPYRIEQEYRIIFESSEFDDRGRQELSVPISMDCIRSITFNQDLPEAIFNSIKRMLAPKFKKRISRSTLFENKKWINKFKSE